MSDDPIPVPEPWAQACIDVGAIDGRVGHGSVTTTERYSHLGDSQWDTVQSVLNGLGAGQTRGSVTHTGKLRPAPTTTHVPPVTC